MATADFVTTRTHDTRAELALQGGAMIGAVIGALTGVSLAGGLHTGNYAAVLLGTAGTIAGSVLCALGAASIWSAKSARTKKWTGRGKR